MKKNKSSIESRRNQLNRDSSSGSEECVFGMHTVVEAIESGRGNKLFLQDDSKGSNVQTLKELAQEHGVPVKWVPKEKLNMLSDNAKHQGIVLMVSPYHYFELNDLLDKVSSETKAPFLLILDSIEDPHNFGSILRTADATGVSGVIIPKHRSVGITGVVAKTSTGAVEHIPVARVNNLNQAVATLKEQGYWIYGTDMEGNDFRTWKTDGSIALIIGNEGRGMSSLLKREVDELLTIPMQGHVQSLNAGVAAGLLMYEVLRTRNPLSK